MSCYPALFLLRLTAPAGKRHGAAPLSAFGLSALIGVAAFSFLEVRAIGSPGFMQQDFPRLIFPAVLWSFFCLLGVSALPNLVEHRHVQFRFQVAAPVMLIFILAGVKSVVPVILFVVFAANALARARWADSISPGMGPAIGTIGSIQPVKSRHWVLGPLSILMPATALFLSLSPDSARTMLRSLVDSGALLLTWLDRSIPRAKAGEPVDILLFSRCSMRPPKEESAFSKMDPLPGGSATEDVLLWGSVLAVLIAAAAFIFFAVKAFRKKPHPEVNRGVSFEAVDVRKSLLSRLAAIFLYLRNISDRLRHLIGNLKPRLLPHPGTHQRRLQTVRELYKALLGWAAEEGSARLPSQTPLEYLESLCGTYPHRNRELLLITELYIRARYGAAGPSPAEFEEAELAWTRVQEAARKRKRSRRNTRRFFPRRNYRD
ncbi:MAG: DUF4129 domain-containing protein [Desulfobacteraceae bacterium]|nr:MAG: DUF4129 domain-containing protein [Desulfobacteraceae bacterium]